MQRRFALSLFGAVGLAALSPALICRAAEQPPAPGTITTVAGTGQRGFSGDGGPAAKAQLAYPLALVVDAAGSILIADTANSRVRKVSPAGMISTVAGTGVAGFTGDGGPATAARLNFPYSLTLDGAGDLFISDSLRVRKVSPEGLITTVAGSGQYGNSGDGGPATEAKLAPVGLAVDAAGQLFIADLVNRRIRKVSPAGIISTVAGSGPSTGNGKDASAGDGGLATAARLFGPYGLALDGAGNLYFSEFGDNSNFGVSGYRVRKVDANGIISTVAGSDRSGFAGDGGPATAARLDLPTGVAVDTAGNLFIGDEANGRVRKVDGSGIISTVAGGGTTAYVNGALATATRLYAPLGLAVDAAGNPLILDRSDRVLKVYGAAAPGLIAGQPFPRP